MNSTDPTPNPPLFLHNSLSNELERFEPVRETVTMYSCGPTVYQRAHIGNFRAFLFSDLVYRTLNTFGYSVRLATNITDIDDKTINAANAKGQSLEATTTPYIEGYFGDRRLLNLLKPEAFPRATEFVPQMVEAIAKLVEKGHAYRTSEGSVYFNLDSFPGYGKLSKIKVEKQRQGASNRILTDEYNKNNVSDFALWKHRTKEDGNIFWKSPFGEGRPGWHIECSVMSKEHLGLPIDIHTGGVDNKFPHHENEIAQSECCYGGEFVRYWMHCSHLMVNGEKMSKSLGNQFTLGDLAERGISPVVVRYMLLSTHYRNEYNFTFEGATSASKAIQRVNGALLQLRSRVGGNPSPKSSPTPSHKEEANTRRRQFLSALADDFNTSSALAEVFEAVRYVNAHVGSMNASDAGLFLQFLRTANDVFGAFDVEKPQSDVLPVDIKTLPEVVGRLLEERERARSNKDWGKADELRSDIERRGFFVTDLAEGFEVRRRP